MNSAKTTERTKSPIVINGATNLTFTTTQQINTNNNNNTSPSNGSNPTTPVHFSGAMKNLTQKYKTMHLATTRENDTNNNNIPFSSISPPPAPSVVHLSTQVKPNVTTANSTHSPTSNSQSYNFNHKTAPYHNHLNNTTLLNSIDVTMTNNHHGLLGGTQGDVNFMNNNNLTRNSEHKSTSSSSSEEPNPLPPLQQQQQQQQQTNHTIILNKPLMKTANLVHRASLNNGPINLNASNLTHSNSTKLHHSEWTQMIKLANNNNNTTGSKMQKHDFNNNELVIMRQNTSPVSTNSDQSNGSSSSSTNSTNNTNNRNSPIVKKISNTSPINLPAIRTVTP
jgi:hypothetical protein